MSEEKRKPFVLSADVEGLMRIWGEQTGHQVPPKETFESIQRSLVGSLEDCFGDVDVVSEEEMRTWMIVEAQRGGMPAVSLDRAYLPSGMPNVIGFIDAARAVDGELNDAGLRPRPGFPEVADQIRTICQDAQRQGVREIAIVDDVVFGGDSLKTLAEQFSREGVQIKRVAAGIAVGEGAEKLEAEGIEVTAMRRYPEVIDEVCERDFRPGVPFSGRLVIDKATGETFGAPYILPFGNPAKWASIPEEKTGQFSDRCLTETIQLWRETERASQRTILLRDLPRRLRVKGVPEDTSVVDLLVAVQKKLRE